MRKPLIAIVCFAVLAVTTGCSHAPDDGQIVKSVQTEIHNDSSLSGDVPGDIKVESEHGMVTLRGHVPGEAERASAARDAAKVTGVAGVYNLLTVATAAEAPHPGKPRRSGEKHRQGTTESPVAAGEPSKTADPVTAAAVRRRLRPLHRRLRFLRLPRRRRFQPPPPVRLLHLQRLFPSNMSSRLERFFRFD